MSYWQDYEERKLEEEREQKRLDAEAFWGTTLGVALFVVFFLGPLFYMMAEDRKYYAEKERRAEEERMVECVSVGLDWRGGRCYPYDE